MQKAHQSRGKHTGNGQHGMGPWLSPSELQKKTPPSHNILTFCSRYALLGSKALSMNLFLIFAFYLAATGKSFTNATNALRKVLNRLSGFLRLFKTFSCVSISDYWHQKFLDKEECTCGWDFLARAAPESPVHDTSGHSWTRVDNSQTSSQTKFPGGKGDIICPRKQKSMVAYRSILCKKKKFDGNRSFFKHHSKVC